MIYLDFFCHYIFLAHIKQVLEICVVIVSDQLRGPGRAIGWACVRVRTTVVKQLQSKWPWPGYLACLFVRDRGQTDPVTVNTGNRNPRPWPMILTLNPNELWSWPIYIQQVSAAANWPARRNHAVDRVWRSPVINYSGRASELWGIINLIDQRRSGLSRSERPPFLS